MLVRPVTQNRHTARTRRSITLPNNQPSSSSPPPLKPSAPNPRVQLSPHEQTPEPGRPSSQRHDKRNARPGSPKHNTGNTRHTTTHGNGHTRTPRPQPNSFPPPSLPSPRTFAAVLEARLSNDSRPRSGEQRRGERRPETSNRPKHQQRPANTTSQQPASTSRPTDNQRPTTNRKGRRRCPRWLEPRRERSVIT